LNNRTDICCRYDGPKDIAWWIQKGNTAEVFKLLDSGVSVDHRDEKLRTPLMWAADRGDVQLCMKLLDRGANINLQVI
jgi:ankyrin repeat protein